MFCSELELGLRPFDPVPLDSPNLLISWPVTLQEISNPSPKGNQSGALHVIPHLVLKSMTRLHNFDAPGLTVLFIRLFIFPSLAPSCVDMDLNFSHNSATSFEQSSSSSIIEPTFRRMP